MKSVVILIAAWFVTGPLAVLPAFAEPDEKAAQRAMEQQRKAAEAQMRRQAEAERKMVEQQNRAMQEQIKAEQRAMQNQQKAMHEQQKAMQNQQKAAQNQQQSGLAKNGSTSQHATTPAHITTTQTSTPVYHSARPYYSTSHVYHRTNHRSYRTNSNNQLDPQTRALLRLKSSLDHVRMGSTVTAAEKRSIKTALMGVVNVPKVPTIASIQTLADHLANGLANRASSSAQTGPMAMTLMGALNSTEFANTELTEIMNEHRSALKNSKVRTTEITPIMESIKTVSSQERYHR
jgi:hypothetical protein